jgi:BlaI family transcriptional regulator, penicillinase repressor
MSDRISEAEHAVMEVLWSRAPLAAQDVSDQLTDTHSWTLATVKTMLSRLVTKGILTSEPAGRKFLYRPVIARTAWVTGESQRLVDRLFGGRLSPLIAQFAAQEALSSDDIAEIEALLQALKQ